MACSLKAGVCFSGFNEAPLNSNKKGFLGLSPPSCSLQLHRDFPALVSHFKGKSFVVSDEMVPRDWDAKASTRLSINAQASICISRAQRWWEKTLKPNMVEIRSAQELVDSLLGAGDRLVIVDFYSPGCGGCRALHPKICQLAEENSNAIFLKVNYEELKTMCHNLHIHVLPFFRFYRGSEGRVCSFSCTNATIKKFKDAVAKYGTDRCSLGPAKGLDESELMRLASAGEISIDLPLPSTKKEKLEDLVMKNIDPSILLSNIGRKMEVNADALVKA